MIPTRSGQPGGRGGAAGISGNGANGPSLGIAYVGAKPVVGPSSHITSGSAAPATPARSRTMLDGTKTIPGTPAGIAQQIIEL